MSLRFYIDLFILFSVEKSCLNFDSSNLRLIDRAVEVISARSLYTSAQIGVDLTTLRTLLQQ